MPDYVVDRLAWTRGSRRVRSTCRARGRRAVAGWRGAPASFDGAGGLEDGFDFVQRRGGTPPASEAVGSRLSAATAAPTVVLLTDGRALVARHRARPPGAGRVLSSCAAGDGRERLAVVDGAARRRDARIDGDNASLLCRRRTFTHQPRTMDGATPLRADGGCEEPSTDRRRRETVARGSQRAASDVPSSGPRRRPVRERWRPHARAALSCSPSSASALPPHRGLVGSGPADARRRSVAMTASCSSTSGDGNRGGRTSPRAGENPLDNEHPDVNSDGVQVHLGVPGVRRGAALPHWWLLGSRGLRQRRARHGAMARLRVPSIEASDDAGWDFGQATAIPPPWMPTHTARSTSS